MSKKIELLEAASKVIQAKGVSQFTLEAVALEANVSKGGLLYHYPSKEALIKAMNIRVIHQFKKLIEKEISSGYSYHEAYLLATLTSLKDSRNLNINTVLLAAITNDRDIIDLWKEEFKDIQKKLTKEKYKPEYSLLIQATCDGIWYSKLFNITYSEIDEEERLINYLLELLRKDQS